jgi:hypothetical protein
MRKRNYFLAGGSFLVLLFAYFSDPNGGALTMAWLQQLTMPVVAVWFAYIARKALFDYLDMEELLNKAKQSTVGAAITFLAVCLVFFGLLGLFGNSARAQDVKTYVPTKALVHIPTLTSEQYRLWPEHPKDI